MTGATLMKPQRENGRGAVRDALLAYGIFTLVSVTGMVAYRWLPGRTTILLISLLPYPMILVSMVTLRANGRPGFPVGSALNAIRSAWPLWLLLAAASAAGIVWTGDMAHHSWLHAVQRLLTFPVLDPLAEEFTFRGAIQTSLLGTALGRGRLVGLPRGIWMAATLFGVVHMANVVGNQGLGSCLAETATALPAGLLFGVIYYRTTNIWHSVLLHGFSNLLMG